MRSILLAISFLPWALSAVAAEPVDSSPAAGDTPKSEAASTTGSSSSSGVGESTAVAESGTEAMEQVGFSRGSVTRSVFTTGVEEREPIDDVKNNDSSTEQIFYFTELRDMSGQTATHRWEHNGEIMAEVDFDVNGPRWRVWSSKTFVPGGSGDWKVSVINGAGEVISEETLPMSSLPVEANTVTEPATTPQPVEEATGQ